jgi:hypothetical protein
MRHRRQPRRRKDMINAAATARVHHLLGTTLSPAAHPTTRTVQSGRTVRATAGSPAARQAPAICATLSMRTLGIGIATRRPIVDTRRPAVRTISHIMGVSIRRKLHQRRLIRTERPSRRRQSDRKRVQRRTPPRQLLRRPSPSPSPRLAGAPYKHGATGPRRREQRQRKLGSFATPKTLPPWRGAKNRRQGDDGSLVRAR